MGLKSRWSERAGECATLAAVLLLALGAGVPVRSFARDQSPDAVFPQDCIVVVLSGLPGDVESETTFHEQTQSWVDLAAASLSVEKVFVLCENPGQIQLPPRLQGKALAATRKNLLALGPVLAARKRPLVLIAFGHGGNLGATPVLHVRGPRINPEDLKQLCAQAAPAGLRSILFFRGSGRFAQELVGPGRQILSSDSETIYHSDPVGMSLLLKLARKEAKSFDELARDLGRAVPDWYHTRNLARTEEPAFWKDQAGPVLLARQTDTEAQGGAGGEPMFAGDEAKETEPLGPTSDKPPKELPAHELGQNWKRIVPIPAEKYPEADGVVLLQRSRVVLGSNPAILTEQESFIQILKPEGKRFGDFDIAFQPPDEDVQFLDCEVLGPDHRLTRLDPDQVVERADQAPGDYQPLRRRVFSLPGVGPGVIVHVRFRTVWQEFPLPYIFLQLPAGHELPALRSEIEVNLPREAAFHFSFEHVAAPAPEIHTTSYGACYSWVLQNLPAHRNDILAPPERRPRLVLSTFPDWKTFAGWYQRITQLTDAVTPELVAKAKALTARARTDREKVAALSDYVTGLRYVALPLGISSVRPHTAASVLANQFGDCKDKANLLNALLRAVNIEARMVLVPRFGQAQPGVPGMPFNHAISRVRLEKKDLWIDPTDDICRFGFLPPGDPGRNVLVIDPATTGLIPLPVPVPEDNRLALTGSLAWADGNQGAPMELKAVAVGFPDYQMRATARDAREHRASLPLLAARFRPVVGTFVLEKQSSSALSDLEAGFRWTAEGDWLGGCRRAGATATLRMPFWAPQEWDQALHRRHEPLYLNQGYPLTLDEQFQIELPPGTAKADLPRPSQNSEGPLRWRIEWTKLGHGKLAARLEAHLETGELSPVATVSFQDQWRALRRALAADVSLSLHTE